MYMLYYIYNVYVYINVYVIRYSITLLVYIFFIGLYSYSSMVPKVL